MKAGQNQSATKMAVPPLSVSLAAPTALLWLEAGQPARPLHVFDSVCNLINAKGAVISLMLSPTEMNPLALVIDRTRVETDFRRLIPFNSLVQIKAGILSVGELRILFDSPVLWSPRPGWEAVRAQWQQVDSLLAKIAGVLQQNASTDSLAGLLRPGALDPKAHTTAWLQRSIDPIRGLLQGLEQLNPQILREAARNLAGLGLGLTPSGDDFIMGVMHALWMTLPDEQAQALCRVMLLAAAPRTNSLSANFLETAARGQASQSWHSIASALAQGDAVALDSPVQRLVSLGHTSGQDALSGLLLAMAHIPRVPA